MPAGRPTLLTREIIQDVRRLLPTVLYLESVGDYLGVSPETWRVWVRRGRKEAKRLANPRAKPRASEALYLEFFATYKKALAEGEIYDLGVIKKASAEQWQAAAWRAERRFPGRWGKKDRVELTGKKGGAVQLDVTVDAVVKARERVQRYRRERLGSSGNGTVASG
jgi:hypothetical protein